MIWTISLASRVNIELQIFLIMEQIKSKKKIFLQKNRFKFSFDICKPENLTEILSFDRKMMCLYNVWPLDRVDIKFSLITILIGVIPGVSIVDVVS